MRTKTFQKLIAIVLVITLTFLNFIMLGMNVVIAIQENLETQSTEIGNSNIVFDAYLKQGEQKTHSKQIKISEGDVFHISINIKNTGVLNDAKIKLENVNFKIATSKLNNSYVKSINQDTNEIFLNQIRYGENIEIELPITFVKKDVVNLNYFDMENSVILSGKYKETSENEKDISAKINTKINWTQETQVETTSEVEKYISLGEKGILLEQVITSSVKDNLLPKAYEKLNIVVPSISGSNPEGITVLVNGKKLEEDKYMYDKEKHTIEIMNSKEISDNTEVIWGNSKDSYKIIYTYNKDIVFENKKIDSNVKATTKLLTIENEFVNEMNKEISVAEKGKIISTDIEMTNSMYKGYMYSKSGDSIYNQKYLIEISSVKEKNDIKLETSNSTYVLNDEKTVDATGRIQYKEIIVDKAQMLELLGSEFHIKATDENGNVVANILENADANENGKIIVKLPENISKLTFTISTPIKEGTLNIETIKTIPAQTDLSKEQLKSIIVLQEDIKTNDIISSAKMNLLDTKTEAKMMVNTSSLSTLEKNTNVEIIADLITNSNQYDLYKNARFTLTLPKGIETIKVNSIRKLYDDELEIKEAKLNTLEDGTKQISFMLAGEQIKYTTGISDGIQLVINADITFNKTTPSSDEKIIINYTNENGNEASYEMSKDIKLQSKYGTMLFTNVKGYNNDGEAIQYIDNETVEGKLEARTEKKMATVARTLINNYDSDIQNVSLIVEGENLKNIKTDREYNVEELENNKHKITLTDTTIKPEEKVNILYDIEIPEKLSYNKTIENKLYTSYSHDNQNTENTYDLKLSTSARDIEVDIEEDVPMNNIEGIGKIGVIATTGGKVLKDGESIFEGQTVKYIVKIENNTGKDITNMKLVANVTNGHVYDYVIKDVQNIVVGGPTKETFIEEKQDVSQITRDIGNVANGETKVIEYQAVANKATNAISGDVNLSAEGINSKSINLSNIEVKNGDFNLKFVNETSVESFIFNERIFPASIVVKNTSNTEKTKIKANFVLPKGVSIVRLDEDYNKERVTLNSDNSITIDKLASQEEITVRVFFTVYVDNLEKKEDVNIYYYIEDNELYVSNEISKVVKFEKADVKIEQTSNIPTTQKVTTGDKVIYKSVIKNNGIDLNGVLKDYVPRAAKITRAYYILNGKTTEITIENNRIYLEIEGLKTNETIELYVETQIDESLAVDKTISNEVTFEYNSGKSVSNSITHTLKEFSDREEDINKPENPEDPNNPENPDTKESFVSGKVWLDKNNNGSFDETDEVISGITTKLMEVGTEKIIKTITSDNQGYYKFENIPDGEYVVIFEYDTTKYSTAIYQKDGVNEQLNSDIISKTIAGKEVGVTNNIKVKNSKITDISAGLVENKIFDLKLDKYISKVTVQDSKGTTTREFNNSKLAKIEIDAKRVTGTAVLVEYKIIVKNQGEVAGYVNEIVDFIPKDMNFNSEINKSWYSTPDGILHNTSLSKDLIKPGETREVTVVLVKTMTENNVGITVNTAEIEKSTNDLSIPDKNSTPGNKVNGEDDISSAELVITIRTGVELTIGIISVIIILTVIGTTVYIIKRKEV